MSKAARMRRAEEALRRDLVRGELAAVGSLVISGPTRRSLAVVITLSLVLVGAGAESLLGPLQAGPAIALAPLYCFGVWFIHRPMYVAVTDRRLICCPLSRLGGTPRRPALTVPLADLRILNYRSGKYATSVSLEFPGRRPVLLHAGREEFAGVDRALARAGAYAKLDPPYPSGGECSHHPAVQ